MGEFPLRLSRSNGVYMRLEPSRLLLAMTQPIAIGHVVELVEGLQLVLETDQCRPRPWER